MVRMLRNWRPAGNFQCYGRSGPLPVVPGRPCGPPSHEEDTVRKVLFVLVGLLLLAGPVFAVGPVLSPQKCGVEWTAPTTNANATPLTDLAKYDLFVSPVPDSFSATPFVSIPSATAAPTANTVVKWDCRAVGLTDGQKYVTVRAVDIAGNASGNAGVDPASGGTVVNGLPFVFDAVNPDGASGLKVSP